MTSPIILNDPQHDFLCCKKKYKAFVTGFGGGKTYVGCLELGNHFLEFPRINAGYFAPTYSLIRDIFYPTIDEAAFSQGFDTKINLGNKEVHFYQGKIYYGTVICRSLEHPETIIGFKIGKALVDELDVMPTAKAELSWRKIIARMRYNLVGLLNGISVTTTPEGFKFIYQQFKKQLQDNPKLQEFYGLIHGSTYDNAHNLPEDYIPSLLASYPEQLVQAYLLGQFVNLTSGAVYVSYDRAKNRCIDTVQGVEPVHIGMDFNVGNMSAVVHVEREGQPRAVDEIVAAYDTPAMIRLIQDKYPNQKQIKIYPDASGRARKTVNASETDLSLLRAAGFYVVVNPSNPSVRDRVNNMNANFKNASGEVKYLVNDSMCPIYADCLEQQVYLNGEPDKKNGNDHLNEAAGYYINQAHPIISARMGRARITGV